MILRDKAARGLAGLWLLLVVVTSAVGAPLVIKNPQALPVIDNAKVLSQDQISSLSIRLRTLADTDGTQVAVLTVPTTGEEDIFTFAQRTATEWGIGQKKESNGALLVVAVKDRKVRIQVGYGLEGRLTDALSKRIIEAEILPEFRKNDYPAGISRGVDAIIAAVRGEYKAPQAASEGKADWPFTVFIILFVLFILWSSRGGGGRGPGGRRRRGPFVVLPDVWSTGGGRSGWSSGGGSGGGFGGGFGGGSFGGGGASGNW